ncbi:MAG: hypothetical protein Q7S55_04680 [Nanoarchaeota archaeon]|nr:hypothetical protein [Nanoarchaeota archaeon]
MTNILKQAARRVSLTDLVQDIDEGKQFLRPLDEGRMKSALTAQVYFRNFMRGLLRVGGDSALLYGVHEAYQNQEIRQIGFGVAMCAMAYILDYVVYERLEKPFWKKDDSS